MASEEIQTQIHDKLKNTYGIPIRNLSASFQTQKQRAVDALSAQKQLGKRDHATEGSVGPSAGGRKIQRIEFDREAIQRQFLEDSRREVELQKQQEDEADAEGWGTAAAKGGDVNTLAVDESMALKTTHHTTNPMVVSLCV